MCASSRRFKFSKQGIFSIINDAQVNFRGSIPFNAQGDPASLSKTMKVGSLRWVCVIYKDPVGAESKPCVGDRIISFKQL